jgi:hypothetical protein
MIGNSSGFTVGGTSWTSDQFPFECFAYDLPNTVGNVVYSLQGSQSGASSTTWQAAAQLSAKEIMV